MKDFLRRCDMNNKKRKTLSMMISTNGLLKWYSNHTGIEMGRVSIMHYGHPNEELIETMLREFIAAQDGLVTQVDLTIHNVAYDAYGEKLDYHVKIEVSGEDESFTQICRKISEAFVT
jgi:hypothetical protein